MLENYDSSSELFTSKMGTLFDSISSAPLEKIHVGLILTKILNLVRKHHIQLEGKLRHIIPH